MNPIDTGIRDIISLNMNTIMTSSPPPIDIVLKGKHIGNSIWGGIPLTRYRDPKIIIKANKDNELTIYEYYIPTAPSDNIMDKTIHTISYGRNIIDLSSHNGILSFKFKNIDSEATIQIHLK